METAVFNNNQYFRTTVEVCSWETKQNPSAICLLQEQWLANRNHEYYHVGTRTTGQTSRVRKLSTLQADVIAR